MSTEKVAKSQKKRRWLGKLFWLLSVPLLLGLGFVVLCNLWVTLSVQNRVFADVEDVPENTVAVVLGTSKNIAPERPNMHFRHRMEAAAKLYQAGKVTHLLVSGSENSRYYNEPRDMENALVVLGVPENSITRDGSGFRTLDSIVRAGEVFGQGQYTIVTDDFHVSRAVFLARSKQQDVVGFAAEPVRLRLSIQSRLREVLARVKAVLDVYFFRTQPRELGEPEMLDIAER